MSVAFELEFEACRPRLYALPDQPARTAPSPRVRRRRVVVGAAVAAAVVVLLVLLALPIRSFGGSTLAQAAPAQGQEYIVKTGDTLASIAGRADPAHAATLTDAARPAGGLHGGRARGAHLHSLTIVGGVRCPWCAVDDDRVVDSRQAEEGGAIRRRRECLGCGRRFTTFERVEEVPLWVVKRSGLREPFDRAKVVEGVRAAVQEPAGDATSRSRSWPRAWRTPCGRRRPSRPASRSAWPCSSGSRRSTTWPTSASPASTRVSRTRATSSGRWGCLTKTTEPKRK